MRSGAKVTPQVGRHALAAAAGDANIPDKKAAELGVWRDPRSLHRYQHVKPDAIPGRTAGSLLPPPTDENGRRTKSRRIPAQRRAS